jgi:hypothetical protein
MIYDDGMKNGLWATNLKAELIPDKTCYGMSEMLWNTNGTDLLDAVWILVHTGEYDERIKSVNTFHQVSFHILCLIRFLFWL